MPVVGVTASLGAAGGTGAGVRWRAAGGFGAICRSGGFDVEGDGSSDITGSGVDGVGCGSAPRRAPTAVAWAAGCPPNGPSLTMPATPNPNRSTPQAPTARIGR